MPGHGLQVPRMTLFYAAFSPHRHSMPFLPVWFAAKGLDEEPSGFCSPSPPLIRMVAVPAAAVATDLLGALKGSLVLASCVAAAATIALGISPAPATMFSDLRGRLRGAGNGAARGCLRHARIGRARSVLRPGAVVGLGRLHRGQPRRRHSGGSDRAGPSDLAGRGRLLRDGGGAVASDPVAHAEQPRAGHAATPRSALLRVPGIRFGRHRLEPDPGQPRGLLRLHSLDWTAAGLGGVTVGALWSVGRGGRDRPVRASGAPAGGGRPVGAAAASGRAARCCAGASWRSIRRRRCCRSCNACMRCRSEPRISAPCNTSRAPRRPALPPPRKGSLAVAGGIAMAIAMALPGVAHASFGRAPMPAMAAMAAAGGAAALLHTASGAPHGRRHLSPQRRVRRDRRGCLRSAGPRRGPLPAAAGPSRSTTRAPCATSMAGAMASDVATMQPTMIARPRRSASVASASASVSPPVLSSLMLTASYFPASASSDARSCTLSSAQTGIGRAIDASASSSAGRQRLLDQRDAGLRAGARFSARLFCPSSLRWHRRSARRAAPPARTARDARRDRRRRRA